MLSIVSFQFLVETGILLIDIINIGIIVMRTTSGEALSFRYLMFEVLNHIIDGLWCVLMQTLQNCVPVAVENRIAQFLAFLIVFGHVRRWHLLHQPCVLARCLCLVVGETDIGILLFLFVFNIGGLHSGNITQLHAIIVDPLFGCLFASLLVGDEPVSLALSCLPVGW